MHGGCLERWKGFLGKIASAFGRQAAPSQSVEKMEIRDFFQSNTAMLPKKRDEKGEDNFLEFVACINREYLQLIQTLSGSDPVYAAIKAAESSAAQACELIKACISAYLDGYPHLAYSRLSDAMDVLKPWQRGLLETSTLLNINLMETDLFRMRTAPGNATVIDFNRRDLFHIPFELRHRVARQRYSIPGLPCLYLGGSLWVCWEELGRPEFHSVHLSRFRTTSQPKILNFGWRPRVFSAFCDNIDESRDILLSQIMFWPLIAASSIRVLHSGAPFAPEYIVPQLLLQWLTNESDYDGLCYFSTKIDTYSHSPTAALNYVFPVKRKATRGYCKTLTSTFSLSHPVPWSVLSNTDFTPLAAEFPPWEIAIGDVRVRYSQTSFWRAEHKLTALPLASLDGDLPF